MWKFLIKECFELRNVDFDEFSFVSLHIDVVLRFCQGVSKNWWIDITHSFVDWFRPDVDYQVVDVILNFNKLTYYCPTSWFVDKPEPHPLFLWSKP